VFPLPGGGPGECGAGVSELIASDLTGAEDALANRRLFSAVLLGVRALLLTQGEFPISNVDALVQFHKHFMTDLQNDPLLEKMVSKAEQYAGGMDPDRDFKADTRSVRAFLTTLRDRIEESEVPSEPEMDLRKMCCPPSARKFRQLLEQTKPGQALTILLDEKGASNLTTCLQMDDFELLGVVQEDTHWRVTVRRRVG